MRGLARTSMLCLAFAFIGQPQTLKATETHPIEVSEVLADPTFGPDADAEFLELCFIEKEPTQYPALKLRIDGRTFNLPPIASLGQHAFILCRDSSAAETVGLHCDLSLPGFSLANGRSLLIELQIASDTLMYVVPVGRPGESQENRNFLVGLPPSFQPSDQPFKSGFSSPGHCLTGETQTKTQSETLDPESLESPRMSSSRLDITSNQPWTLAIPQSFSGGRWRILTASGNLVFTSDLPQHASVQTWSGRDAKGQILPPGPYVLLLQAGRKKWMKALVLTEGGGP